MHFVRALFIIFLLHPLLSISDASAQLLPTKKDKTKILLNADFIERDNEKDITILRDNVQIIFDQNFISCNEAIVLWSKNEVVAVGNVLLKTQKSSIQGDKIIYNFKEEKGKIYNGIILSGKVLMQSEYIEKTGPDTYKADNAYFTACTTCPASWSFTADNVEATIEGYAYMTSPWLNILEFPSIYSPYLIIPLKNERQTGLLTPSFEGSKRTGTGIEIPYFWAINRSQDMTVSLKTYEKRGIQGSLNYRYRLSQNSGGEFNGSILPDKALDYKTRWFTSYSHYLELPNDYVQRTTIHLISDLDYILDFPKQMPFTGEPALDNRTSLTKNFPDYHLSLDSSYYMSLIQNSVDDSKDSSVHRLPEIRFSITDKKLLDVFPLFFRLDAQYVNFARQGLGYDSPFTLTAPQTGTGYRPVSPTGEFNPTTDKVRTGQRLDFQPYLYSPWRLFNKTLDVTPFIAYRHTQYLLGALNESQDFDFYPHRNYTMVGVNTSTELSAIYQGSKTKYRHSVIPSISFQSIPSFYQKNHPFFGTQEQIPYFLQTQPLQDLDLQAGGRGLQFDYEDRIVGRRLVNLGITNRVIRKNSGSSGNSYDQPFLFSVSQAYDFIEAKKSDGLPWQDIRALLNVRWGLIDSFTEVFQFPYHKVTNVSSRLKFDIIGNNSFEVQYSNYLNVPARPIDVNKNTRQERLWFTTVMDYKYMTLSGKLEYSLIEDRFNRWGAKMELIPPGRCWTIYGDLELPLDQAKDNINYNVMINFNFGT